MRLHAEVCCCFLFVCLLVFREHEDLRIASDPHFLVSKLGKISHRLNVWKLHEIIFVEVLGTNINNFVDDKCCHLFLQQKKKRGGYLGSAENCNWGLKPQRVTCKSLGGKGRRTLL